MIRAGRLSEDIDTTTLHLSGFTLKAQANAQTSEKDCATGPGVTCVDIPIGPQQERQLSRAAKKGGNVPVGPLHTCHEYVDNCLCKAGVCDPPHFPKVRWRDILMTGFRD